MEHSGDIVLCVDTNWRDRYANRSEHPEAAAEKVIAQEDLIARIHRDVVAEEATGEYIGVIAELAHGFELGNKSADEVNEKM